LAIYRDIRDINFEKTVVTVGSFDGVHSGHKLLLQRVVDLAKQNHLRSVVLTFWPHPRYVLGAAAFQMPPNELNCNCVAVPMLLNTLDEKITLLNQSGIDDVIVFPFDKYLSQMSASEFINEIIIEKLNARYLVVGQDHHFGNKRSGNVNHLQDFTSKSDLQIDVVDLKNMKTFDWKISSSEIRKVLLNGDMNIANEMLGYEYMISGKVIDGRHIGRSIGFPTANIETFKYKLLPKEGVYRVKVNNFDKLGMLYIGKRPLFKQEDETVHVEVNIFDFDKHIYGQEVTLSLTHYIRGNTKFENVEQLVEQLQRDKQIILDYPL